MEIDVAGVGGADQEHLMNSLVVPRPIAWVGTQGADGVRNLAPFSYFTLVSSTPPVVLVSFSPSGRKDSLDNITETGEFVVNVVADPLRHPMVASSAELDHAIDEMDLLGLGTAPSVSITPPRLAAAPAALECVLHQVIPVYGSTAVLGRVLHVHVADEVMRDGRVVAELLAPVARLGGSLYTTVSSSYRIDRPRTDDPELVRAAAHAPGSSS